MSIKSHSYLQKYIYSEEVTCKNTIIKKNTATRHAQQVITAHNTIMSVTQQTALQFETHGTKMSSPKNPSSECEIIKNVVIFKQNLVNEFSS